MRNIKKVKSNETSGRQNGFSNPGKAGEGQIRLMLHIGGIETGEVS